MELDLVSIGLSGEFEAPLAPLVPGHSSSRTVTRPFVKVVRDRKLLKVNSFRFVVSFVGQAE